MRQSPHRVVIGLLGILLVAGCGDREGRKSGQAGRDKQADTPAEGRLDILAWPGFAHVDGVADDDRWLRSFEKATACEVHIRRVAQASQLLAFADKEGVDLMISSGETSLSLIQSGKVQALDLSRVPAYRGISPRLANGGWHTVDGVHYGVPFQWQLMSLHFPARTSGIDGSFGERLINKESASWRSYGFNQPIRIADAALYLQARRPDLKIDDPFELSEIQYAAALDVVRRQRALTTWAGNDAVAGAGDGSAATDTTAGTGPESGIAWSDVAMLHAKARHPNCAMAWMQWSLQAKNQAMIAESFGSFPVVAAACDQNVAAVATACQSPAYGRLTTVYFQRTPEARCGKGQCVPYSRWVRDFHALEAVSELPDASGKGDAP